MADRRKLLKPVIDERMREHGTDMIPSTAEDEATVLMMSTEDYLAFRAMLDRPPRDLPRLRRLLTEPSVLDKDTDG